VSASPTPALDFLRRVEMWQQDQTGTAAGLAVALPDSDSRTLSQLLAQFRGPHPGATADLEARARFWLIGYREANPPLTDSQRAELDAVIGGFQDGREWWQLEKSSVSRDPSSGTWLARHAVQVVITLAVIAVSLCASVLIWHAIAGSSQGSPPAAGAPVNPAQQPAQGPLTGLQQFRADWNVPAAASPSAGTSQAQLVLLQDGLYYPAPWAIPAGDPGWAADTTGSVTATVSGGQADVTDSDGTTWTVSVGQPFVLSGNPQVVLRVLRDATVQSMPGPHAIAVRKPF